jgi:hypothetical protein
VRYANYRHDFSHVADKQQNRGTRAFRLTFALIIDKKDKFDRPGRVAATPRNALEYFTIRNTALPESTGYCQPATL